jgi:PPOX class probable F420-dependent enzyme
MAQRLEGRAKDLVQDRNFATVSTLREDGTVHNVVVWVDTDDAGNVLVNSAEGRVWRENVTRDPRVTVTVPNHENPYEFVSITGRVAGEDHADADAHIDRLAKKYLDKDSYPFRQEGEQRVKLTIAPERVSLQGG